MMKENFLKISHEWFKQADYDIKTAEAMFVAKKYIYTVFMCHLSIEKALKGLYSKKLELYPPKSHDLIYLISKLGIKPEENIGDFIDELNDQGVLTRYPNELSSLIKAYNKEKASRILLNTKEVLKWIKKI